MSLEELLSLQIITYKDIDNFVSANGLSNVSTADLDKLIAKFDDVVRINDFYSLYNIVSTNETNKEMAKWTKITMKCTVVVTVATFINLLLFTLDIFDVIAYLKAFF